MQLEVDVSDAKSVEQEHPYRKGLAFYVHGVRNKRKGSLFGHESN